MHVQASLSPKELITIYYLTHWVKISSQHIENRSRGVKIHCVDSNIISAENPDARVFVCVCGHQLVSMVTEK